MGLFGKRGQTSPGESDVEVPEEAAEASDQSVISESTASAASDTAARTAGPWDEMDDIPEAQRIDLGALAIPQSSDYRIQVQADQNTGVITQVSLVSESSAVQLQPYAAPRSGGMWDDIRGQLATQINKAGGLVEQTTGSFGVELHAQMAGQDGKPQPARFCGVDGPRWFLRLVFLGPAARDPQAAAILESAVRGVVVMRGDQAMPMGNVLPLRLPSDGASNVGSPTPATPNRPTITLPERGPEITETR